MAKKYKANTNIKHGGKWYKPGAEISLEADEVEILGADVSLPGDEEDQRTEAEILADQEAEASRLALREARSKELDASTVEKLKEHAEVAKIDLGAATRKDDIIAAIVSAEYPAPGTNG